MIREIPCYGKRKINTEISFPLQLILMLNVTLILSPMEVLNFMWKNKYPRITMKILKKKCKETCLIKNKLLTQENPKYIHGKNREDRSSPSMCENFVYDTMVFQFRGERMLI